eukprot:Lithocolla_globosa_v1_NODE_3207_length_1733_cov_151.573897.p1 type:complete len:466 gc:universal NODE_3207_length_1733_cov_151.573897:45-1442(+)
MKKRLLRKLVKNASANLVVLTEPWLSGLRTVQGWKGWEFYSGPRGDEVRPGRPCGDVTLGVYGPLRQRAALVKEWSTSSVIWMELATLEESMPRIYVAGVSAFGMGRASIFKRLLSRVTSLCSGGAQVLLLGDFNTPLPGFPVYPSGPGDAEAVDVLLRLEGEVRLLNRRVPTTTYGGGTLDLVNASVVLADALFDPCIAPLGRFWSRHFTVSLASAIPVASTTTRGRREGRARYLQRRAGVEWEPSLSTLMKNQSPAAVMQFQCQLTARLAAGPCYLPDVSKEWSYLASQSAECARDVLCPAVSESAAMRSKLVLHRAAGMRSGDIRAGDRQWVALHKEIRKWDRREGRERRQRHRDDVQSDSGLYPTRCQSDRSAGLPPVLVDELSRNDPIGGVQSVSDPRPVGGVRSTSGPTPTHTGPIDEGFIDNESFVDEEGGHDVASAEKAASPGVNPFPQAPPPEGAS